MKLKELFNRFFRIRKCGGCGEILDYEFFNDALCPECALKWRIAKTESCNLCAQSAVECICMPKGLAKTGALCLRKLYFYNARRDREPQNRLIYFIKKNPNKRIASFVARELWELAREELYTLGVEDVATETVIVNVPRGRSSKRLYGFDQSALICQRMSLISGAPYSAVISRRKGGKEQKQLNRQKRFKNVEKLFWVEAPENVTGKYVLLFDDVVTTGASMAACAGLLKKNGVRGIICLCVAQVPQNTAK